MDMRKRSEAETSGSESSATDYEVFLSFRGPDTCQGFTDCLYHGMLDANIRVFFDEEELHVGKEIGDELPTAIEKSKIYIPIFSKGYASSAWCLRELAHMVECKKSKPSEKEIMPIFYNVKPRDVKLMSQQYIGALEEHEKKFGPQTRGKWEDALKSVAKIKGWELKKQGKEAIEAVCIARKTYTSKEFSKLPNIRFLKLHGAQLDGDFENQLSELRYMSWPCCPPKFLAINFHPGNLVVLKLSHGIITEDWAGWSQIMVAKKLKVLDLTDCFYLTRTTDFSHYTSLERLILENCSSLIEVDDSLEKLKCLIYFNANSCTSLRELPEGIGRLEKLEYLYLRNCKELRKLPESFERVQSLVELDISYAAITRFPDSIGNQKHLSVLNLQSTNIIELPSSIGNLRKLKSLVLSCTKIRELPVSIRNLESLLELDISVTQCLWLPESIGDLSRLKVINISFSLITELPWSIVALKELEELHAMCCDNLKWEIAKDIREISHLRVLNLASTSIGNVPTTIKLLPRLEKLELFDCTGPELLPELPTSLIRLSFGSSMLRWVSDLSNLTKLVNLSFSGPGENTPLFLQDGPCLQSLTLLPPSVSTLSLEYHESITSLSFRCNLRNLTRLHIYQCCWKEVQVDGLEQLIEFIVEGLELLEGFASLSRLKSLKRLRLIICPNLTAIQGLGSVESLEHLIIHRCPKIESLDDLSDLKKLKTLFIGGCDELQAVKGLDELEALKNLEFLNCRSLRIPTSVLNWKAPDECSLSIGGCPNLEENKFAGHVSEYKQRKVQEERGERRKRSEDKAAIPSGSGSTTEFLFRK